MQKAKEAMGTQKKPGNETQEPAGVMENRSHCAYLQSSDLTASAVNLKHDQILQSQLIDIVGFSA